MEKAYKTYKDSGVEWIGEIPLSWGTLKIKYLNNEENSIFIDGDWIESKVIEENGIRYLTTGNIGPGYYKEQGKGFISEETFKELNCTEVYPGDLVISRLNKPIGRACIIPELGYRIIVAVDNVILRPNSKFNRTYLMYLMNSIGYSEYTDLISRGATMQRISRGQLGNISIPAPDLQEQIQIASYLDYHIGILDKVITKKQTLITKLQEQRQAIINEAVTKGLNKNVVLKDSGIEWLGEIPDHWEVVKFIRFCNLQQGLQINISQRFLEKVEGALEYITTKSIHNPDDYRQYVVGAKQSVICNEDEVLLGRTGNTGEVVTGVSGVFHNNFFKINFNEDFITKDYLVHYLNTSFIQELIGIVAGTTTIPDLNHGDFLNLPFIMPPIKEQIDIVEKINSKYQIIDKSISDIQASIQKLKDYRESLISEAVTGKIDVRDWQKPNN